MKRRHLISFRIEDLNIEEKYGHENEKDFKLSWITSKP